MLLLMVMGYLNVCCSCELMLIFDYLGMMMDVVMWFVLLMMLGREMLMVWMCEVGIEILVSVCCMLLMIVVSLEVLFVCWVMLGQLCCVIMRLVRLVSMMCMFVMLMFIFMMVFVLVWSEQCWVGCFVLLLFCVGVLMIRLDLLRVVIVFFMEVCEILSEWVSLLMVVGLLLCSWSVDCVMIESGLVMVMCGFFFFLLLGVIKLVY